MAASLAQREQPTSPFADVRVAHREWNGATVNLSQWWGEGEACSDMTYQSDVRLTALLEETGPAHCEPRLSPDRPCPTPYVPRNMQFAPAGMQVWGYCKDMRYIKDVTMVFHPIVLEERLGSRLSLSRLSEPRLRFSDGRLWPLLDLLAQSVDEEDPSMQLYGDSLVLAIVSRLFELEPLDTKTGTRPLGSATLRRVIAYLDAHLPSPVALADLAGVAGLSQGQFSRAFKAATGLAPYQWQLKTRLDLACRLLVDPTQSLDDVAAITGFTDASHFCRHFRRAFGLTPTAWREQHGR